MITVRKSAKGVVRPIYGNPTVTSLDGTRKVRLVVIMQESWSAAERAAFGIYQAEPFEVPKGKMITGPATFEMTRGKVREVYPTKAICPPARRRSQFDELRAEIAKLKRRVAELELMNV